MTVDAEQPDICEARFALWALRSTSRAFWHFAATLCTGRARLN
jgi:hypothetical protein